MAIRTGVQLPSPPPVFETRTWIFPRFTEKSDDEVSSVLVESSLQTTADFVQALTAENALAMACVRFVPT